MFTAQSTEQKIGCVAQFTQQNIGCLHNYPDAYPITHSHSPLCVPALCSISGRGAVCYGEKRLRGKPHQMHHKLLPS